MRQIKQVWFQPLSVRLIRVAGWVAYSHDNLLEIKMAKEKGMYGWQRQSVCLLYFCTFRHAGDAMLWTRFTWVISECICREQPWRKGRDAISLWDRVSFFIACYNIVDSQSSSMSSVMGRSARHVLERGTEKLVQAYWDYRLCLIHPFSLTQDCDTFCQHPCSY